MKLLYKGMKKVFKVWNKLFFPDGRTPPRQGPNGRRERVLRQRCRIILKFIPDEKHLKNRNSKKNTLRHFFLFRHFCEWAERRHKETRRENQACAQAWKAEADTLAPGSSLPAAVVTHGQHRPGARDHRQELRQLQESLDFGVCLDFGVGNPKR